MISRYYLECPGCGDSFTVRLGVEPTTGTRFYIPCPHCSLPIRGSMAGTEFDNHKVDVQCKVLQASGTENVSAPVITINPFVPALYEADSFSGRGSFPTMTLVRALGDSAFTDFELQRHLALDSGRLNWPKVRILFEYYLEGNVAMMSRVARQHFGVNSSLTNAHERTSVAYQAMGLVASAVVGRTGTTGETIISRFARKHTAALRRPGDYLAVIGRRAAASAGLERDLFTEINRYVEQQEAWEMGLFVRFLTRQQLDNIDDLVLYRDEFSTLRDLYQQGFELACKCLWVLVAAQNMVKSGNPDDFGSVHPAAVPATKRAGNLNQFGKLANAYKIAYVTQVPGWESIGTLLDSQRRNTIGHATARHDLRTGRVLSDKDLAGMAYLEFLGEVLDVLEALTTLAQVWRAARVASSTDLGSE